MAPASWKLGLLLRRLAIGRALFRLMAAIAATALLGGHAAAAPPESPLAATRFAISIDGVEIAAFSELQGITTEVEPIPSSNQPPARSLTVVLKRGMTRNIEMSAWHELVLMGDVAAARRNVSIVAYGADGKPVARYHLTNAWPSKMQIGTLRSGSSEVLIETVTMTCEFMQRIPT